MIGKQIDIDKYWREEGLVAYFDEQPEESRSPFDAVSGERKAPLPIDKEDLVRLHFLIRSRKSFTVLEFGIGFSTVVIADALKKNQEDWNRLSPKPEIRNRHLFKCFSVDSSEEWIEKTKARLPDELSPFVQITYSDVEIGTFRGQLCHYYSDLPDIVPDFVYLDGPDPNAVSGTIRGLSFQCDERTVTAADLLLMEPTFLPGTFILIDGRTNNARFLKNNFVRVYDHVWDKDGDITTFELVEERLGKYNVLGVDFFKNI